MNPNTEDRPENPPNRDKRKSFDQDQPSEVAGQPTHDRSRADDKGEGLRNKPKSESAAIPPLDEPDVEGVGNESGTHMEATMPPRKENDPKRNTM